VADGVIGAIDVAGAVDEIQAFGLVRHGEPR
jgi:hypothetical protein